MALPSGSRGRVCASNNASRSGRNARPTVSPTWTGTLDGSRALTRPCSVSTVTIWVVPRYSVPKTRPRIGAASRKRMCSGRTPSTSGPAARCSRISGTAMLASRNLTARSARLEAGLEVQEIHRRRADEVGDEHAGRPIVDLLRRSDLLDPADVHDRDAIRHRHRFELVVRDIDRGRRDAVVQIAQLAAHQVAELGVERAERLVHQERLRPPDDGAAKRHALAVAAGQFRGLARRADARCAGAAPFRSTRSRISRRGMPWHLSGKPMFCSHVHMRIEREQLEDEGDVALRRAAEGDVLAVEQDAAARSEARDRRSCAASSSCRSLKGRARQRRSPFSMVKFESCTAVN